MSNGPEKTRNPNFVHAIAADVSKETLLVRGASSVSTGASSVATSKRAVYYYEIYSSSKPNPILTIERDSIMPDDMLNELYINGYRVFDQSSYTSNNWTRSDGKSSVEMVRHIKKKYKLQLCGTVVKRENGFYGNVHILPIGAFQSYLDAGAAICRNPIILFEMLGFSKKQVAMNDHSYNIKLNKDSSETVSIPRHSIMTSNNKKLVLEQVASRAVFNALTPHIKGLKLEWSNNPKKATFTLPLDSNMEPLDKSQMTIYDAATKSINSFKEIGSGFYEGIQYRGQYAYDSPGRFLNAATLGISDELYYGNKERSAIMFDSPYNFFNALLWGLLDVFKGSVAPEDPLSKEHWMDSLGFVSVLCGGHAAGRAATASQGASRAAPVAASKQRIFTSPDKYVAETANAIEARFPGRVIDVNKDVYRPNGTKLTDFDIELDNIVIQVKSGGAKGLTSQITETATGTTKTVIGYAPNLNPSSALVKGAKAQGIDVFTSLDDLLEFLAKQ